MSRPPIVPLHPVKGMEESFMSSSREFMEGFYQIVVGQFWNIELVFEIQGSIDKFPIHLGGSGNPGFSFFVIHGG